MGFKSYCSLVLSATIFTLCSTTRGDSLFTTDFNNGRISSIPSAGGSASTFATGLTNPEGLAFGPSGTLYVANEYVNSQGGGVIDSVNSSGVVTHYATISGANFGGLVANAAGDLFVCLQGTRQAIDEITPTGAVLTYATGVDNGQGLAFDSRGDLFAADFTDGEIFKVPAGGGAATVFVTGITHATGVAVDTSGNVYAASNSGNYVEKLSTTGTKLGSYTVTTPWGITFDTHGDLLVASTKVSTNIFGTTDTGSDVYSIAPGTTTATVFATGLNAPFYIADGSMLPQAVSTPLPKTALAGAALLGFMGLSRVRRRMSVV